VWIRPPGVKGLFADRALQPSEIKWVSLLVS
jgi:hypothetical protein